MTLAFSTHINGQLTHFVEKIWAGLISQTSLTRFEYRHYNERHLCDFGSEMSDHDAPSIHTKLHTIRKDEKDRWKEGQNIHMVIHNRTPKRFQFAPVVKCVSVQEIEIQYHDKPLGERIATVHIDGQQYGTAIWKDCKLIHNSSRLDSLVANDGFESVNDFFEYFNKDFTGKIIHWTNLKY